MTGDNGAGRTSSGVTAKRGRVTVPARAKQTGVPEAAGLINTGRIQNNNMPLHNRPPHASRDTDSKHIDYNDAIRANYYGEEELAACGEALARDGAASLPGFSPFDFRARHRENEKEVFRVYRATARDVEAGASITPAAEWLLDNYYVVEEAIQEVSRDFPRRFYRQLPTMEIGGTAIPRTLALAWLYVAHTQSSVSRASLTAIVEGFQKVEPFKIG